MLWFPQLLLLLFLSACSSSSDDNPGSEITHLTEVASTDYDKFYFDSVKPILDKRCVTCHACYTSPCQLNLTHIEGVRRGATKIPLYDGERLKSAQPTRLFIDAHSALEWFEKKGFFPVARPHPGELSILEAMVDQRVKNPGPVEIPASNSMECPATPEEIGKYQEEFPNSGMPYGLPPLSANEMKIIKQWMEHGYPKLTPEREAMLGQPKDTAPLERWEKIWNDQDPRNRIVARYIYEHLFLGHLQLPELPGEFYRMVRSRTAFPKKIDIIATVWPYDDPGKTFYYRLQKVQETLTLKNHMVYPLGDNTWNRWQELFYKKAWTLAPSAYPSYENAIAGNPFKAFAAIPVESRYRFLLDNSYFFVSSFIKGPVCEGDVAVNVIDEHFVVFFLDPNQDLERRVPDFLEKAASDLALPTVAKDDFLGARYIKFKNAQMEFIKQKHKLLTEAYPTGMELNYIWDGDGKNPQAALTVFRHFNDAYVEVGVQGGPTKTLWVLDYPIFERMYYLLVAGFDVFGNVMHQATTRRYMNDLRVEAEDMFLSFMPAQSREPYRDYWYRGMGAKDKLETRNPYSGVTASSRIPFTTKDPKRDFVQLALNERFNSSVRGIPYNWPKTDQVLQQLSTVAGSNFVPLPDISLILVEGEKGKDRLYSLVHHRGHLNVNFLFVEDSRLAPKEDQADVIPGVSGSFPSFFLKVPEDQVATFVHDTLQLEEKNQGKLNAWVKKYGISRRNPEFWTYFDRIQLLTDQSYKEASGILDISKYMLW